MVRPAGLADLLPHMDFEMARVRRDELRAEVEQDIEHTIHDNNAVETDRRAELRPARRGVEQPEPKIMQPIGRQDAVSEMALIREARALGGGGVRDERENGHHDNTWRDQLDASHL